MTTYPPIFARGKVAADSSRVARWLAGERVFPETIELDLTDKCTRECPSCPFRATRNHQRFLSLRFLDRLFGIVEGQTPGLILSGGEPTVAPAYPEVMALARRRGFTQIATITNGTCLDRRAVQQALLEHGTAVRISLYDWDGGELKTVNQMLERAGELRRRADREGSRLEIGVSLLTSSERLPYLIRAAEQVVQRGGPHWLYFHPLCHDWTARPVQADQTGVIEALDALQERVSGRLEVQVARDRYDARTLTYTAFHAAHFLLQVGADGANYLAPEAKYRDDCRLLPLDEDMPEGFLHHPQRLRRIAEINSSNYPVQGTRHRGSIFSDTLQRLLDSGSNATVEADGSSRYRSSII